MEQAVPLLELKLLAQVVLLRKESLMRKAPKGYRVVYRELQLMVKAALWMIALTSGMLTAMLVTYLTFFALEALLDWLIAR
jgi:hypothetical protein